EDHKLVAAHPAHGVFGTEHLGQSLGDLLEELVAGGVAESVVDVLEAVEVEEEDGGLALAAPRVGERLAQAVAEQAAVRQAGEWIMQGEMSDLLLRASALGDVLGAGDERFRLAARVGDHIGVALGRKDRAVAAQPQTLAAPGLEAAPFGGRPGDRQVARREL